MESDSSSNDSASDSDEVLEEVTFFSKSEHRRIHPCTPIKTEVVEKKDDADQSVGRRLDALLTTHKEEVQKDEIHQKIKSELFHSIEQGFQPETFDDSLNGEFAEYIEQLEVATPTLLTDHLSMTVFTPNKFCCLFKETINPFSCGFSRSHFSKIDKVLATYKFDDLAPLLMSNILPTCFHQVSSPHCVLVWLIRILSIHPSSMVVNLCSQNLINIIQNTSARMEDSESTEQFWCPKPIEIIRILLNMGVNPVYLLGDQSIYSDEDIKEHLSVENDENDSMPTRSSGQVQLENCQRLLEVLTKCFQTRPDFTHQEISLTVCIIIKISLDSSFQSLELHHTFQALLSAILECYKESEWKSVVPHMCHQLSTVPHHHSCSVYITNMMPLSIRGNYVQTRLSFLLLCSTLEPMRSDEIFKIPLDSLPPSRIAHLGRDTQDHSQLSPLYICLRQLIIEDVNKMNSALTLLDRAVGDETNRTAQPKEELQFLTNQVKMAINDIRDSINTFDLSRLKDKMMVMTVKWMMMSSQNTKSVQRSIFSWLTSTPHTTVREEKLQDSASSIADEEINL